MTLSTGLVSGERHRSREAFADRAARGAAGLVALGLEPGDPVALLLRNDIAFLEATVAAQKAGCFPVPINWHFKGDEVGYVLGDCRARVLVGHADLLAAVRDHLPDGLTIVAVETPPEVAAAFRLVPEATRPVAGDLDWESWLAAHDPAAAPAPGPMRESVVYTSGTTGRPKGVLRRPATPEEAAKVDRMRQAVYGFRDGMRTVLVAPMYHSAPNMHATRSLRHAEFLLIHPRFDAEALLAAIERERLTHLFLVPTMFARLLKLPAAVRERADVSSVEFVTHAGSPCPPDVKRAMIEWFGPVIHEYYGGTETGCATFVTSAESLARPGTVGRPIEGCRMEIVRPDGTLAGPGEPGEVFMRVGYNPDFTYIGRDDLRREVDRDGLVTCGDIGFQDDDGYLFLCDRKRDMVIVGGVNVYPAEIEGALTGMPGVADSAVFGIPHPEYGEELMAAVQPQPGEEVDPEAVRAFLAERLADYKVPRRIEIRFDLPREDSGKIFKRRLRDPYWQGAGRAI